MFSRAFFLLFQDIIPLFGCVFGYSNIYDMVTGYLRVSTEKQNPENQREEILRFAAEKNIKVDSWVTEVASGGRKESDRKLGMLLRKMKTGDVIIVTEVSRLSRRLTDIMAIMGKCLKKNISLYTTKEGYTFDNTINSKVLCFAFGLVAEIERNLISMRTKEALAARKASGVVLGRRKGSYRKLNILIDNRVKILAMLGCGRSIAEICRYYKVSRDTFAKFRSRYPSVQKAVDMARTGRECHENYGSWLPSVSSSPNSAANMSEMSSGTSLKLSESQRDSI